MQFQPFSYELPHERIAQRPTRPYHSAKLLCVAEQLEDSSFWDLPSLLRDGDTLVFNNTAVIPARFMGALPGTGRAIEFLFVREGKTPELAICLAKPMRKLKPGLVVDLEGASAEVIERVGEREVLVKLRSSSGDELPVRSFLEQQGAMPIPPYIRDGVADEEDKVDYQTHFGAVDGSVAAPTASLHFTPELMQKLDEAQIRRRELTLHVGTASFLALQESSDGNFLPPGEERCEVSAGLLEELGEIRRNGGRVIPVGTTSLRALESAAQFSTGSFSTELFIEPGYKFKICDALITNFHQPGTTHLFILEALLGKERLSQAYQHALESNYRFLSYGDGMIVEYSGENS